MSKHIVADVAGVLLFIFELAVTNWTVHVRFSEQESTRGGASPPDNADETSRDRVESAASDDAVRQPTSLVVTD